MLNLSVAFDNARRHLLRLLSDDLNSGNVLHIVVDGPTLAVNFEGIGPWARIAKFDCPRKVIYPQSHTKRTLRADYVVMLFVPRIFTSSDPLATILHEYLHIGPSLGEMYRHPPGREHKFIGRAQKLANKLRNSRFKHPSLRFLDTTWNQLHKGGITGFTVQSITKQCRIVTFGDPIRPIIINLNSSG